MARIEDTAGNVTYTIPNCDCGLTGGCEKCQPIYTPKHSEIEYVFPEPHEERFMDENLKEFYRKKGLLHRCEL